MVQLADQFGNPLVGELITAAVVGGMGSYSPSRPFLRAWASPTFSRSTLAPR